MYKKFRFFYYFENILVSCLFLGILLAQNEIIYDEGYRRLEANAGPDIHAPSFSTIMLDASRSVHKKGSLLRYEWFLPPSLVFYDDYSYSDTDTVRTHDNSTDPSEELKRQSWKSISTKSKYIEIDLPEHPEGTKIPIVLKIKDPIGFTDTDTVMVIFKELRTRMIIAEPDSDSIDVDYDLTNQEEDDDAIQKERPSFFISIQPLNRGELYPMETEMINRFLYQEILSLDINFVLDPNQFKPDSIIVKELVQKTKFVFDTLIVSREPELDTLSGNVDSIAIEISDTTVNIDTLEYDQLVESVFYYNSYCKTDSCAAVNAKIEDATHVLSWGFNSFSELELHYFNAEKYLKSKPVYSWTVSQLSMDPDAQKELRYPMAISIAEDGLIISSANTQKVYKLNNDQKLKPLGREIILGKSLLYPSGIVTNPAGKIFISDRDNNRVFSVEENMARKLIEPKLNQDGTLKKNQPVLPTSLALGPTGDIYILYEQSGTIVKVQSQEKVVVALQPGIVDGAKDIAVNKGDTLFVTSVTQKRVYRIDNDTTAIVIAGTEKGDNLVRNNVLASKSYLGNPISIDIDKLGNIYIADERFGLIRKIDNDGLITSIAGINNKIEDIIQIRVTPEVSPDIYVTQALKHSIKRISLNGVYPPWRADTTILHPKYIIDKEGIYGLEPDLRAAVKSLLIQKTPIKKPKLSERSREFNRRVMGFIGRHPFLFAVLLLLLNQGLSASIDGGNIDTDLPPDFPF